jgi:rhodanese-related sulfurtransferase
VKQITASELAQSNGTRRAQWVDVRSASEYAAGHLPGAVNIPMEQIEARLDDLRPDLPVVLICQSGKRARMVAGLLQPCREDVAVLEGGTSGWIKAGLPVVVSAKTRWSLERQVRLGAGLLVVIGTVLAALASPYWLCLSGFVGLGLTFAGLTDFCPMGVLLSKLPWNGAPRCGILRRSAKGESCSL